MPALIEGADYFVAEDDIFVYETPGRKKRNHLLLGDWLRYLGEDDGDWVKVRARGTTGWVKADQISPDRKLEINFVDIGQGDGCHIVTPEDEVMLIDAGIGDNMNRFLSWRYNLRGQNVPGTDDYDPTEPVDDRFEIAHAVISHPDADHYRGFLDIFENPKFLIRNVYHNGIVERPIDDEDKIDGLEYPSGQDIGGYVRDGRMSYLWEVVRSDSELKRLIRKHRGTRKHYLPTLDAALLGNDDVTFHTLSSDDAFMPGYEDGAALTMRLLGPVTERASFDGRTRRCLRRLGSEGETKNGHSIVIRLEYGKMTALLGGDLNTMSQDYLLQHYCETGIEASKLEAEIHKLEAKGSTASLAERNELTAKEAEHEALIARARTVFECDVAKACHHGSSHVSETFVAVVNATATVISSGDEESHSHPRPDALGAFGKHGRGSRPLIFSTELARSTREFTPVIKFLEEIEDYKRQIAAAPDAATRRRLKRALEQRRDRNVAVYGMITVRTDGEMVVIAQKLEKPGSGGRKWDIHRLFWNDATGALERHNKH